MSTPCHMPERFYVQGCPISAINLDSARACILRRIHEGAPGYVCVTDAHGIYQARRDPAFRTILARSFLSTPDGMPLVWLGRRRCGAHVSRVYGPDLLLEMCTATAGTGHRHFFYGGKPGVADDLARQLRERFPGLKVSGTYCPPFRELDGNELKELHERLSTDPPDFFWVGLSTPTQERFMAAHSGKLPAKLMIGVGAAFDFHTGRVPQAPRWMQRSGLEWLWRVNREPGRLGRRYLVVVPSFLWNELLAACRLRRFATPPEAKQ